LGYCVKLIFEDIRLVAEFYISVLFVSFVESMHIYELKVATDLSFAQPPDWGALSQIPPAWVMTLFFVLANLVKLRIVPPNNGGSRLRSNVKYFWQYFLL
jgi:hypothetical protein